MGEGRTKIKLVTNVFLPAFSVPGEAKLLKLFRDFRYSVLYDSETCSFTLREGHRLRVFENRILRRIFGLKRDEN
jgi:hypothetical protein